RPECRLLCRASMSLVPQCREQGVDGRAKSPAMTTNVLASATRAASTEHRFAAFDLEMTNLMPFYDNGPCAGREGHCRAGAAAMSSSIAFVISHWAGSARARRRLAIALIAALHLAALGLLLWSEVGLVPKLLFCLTWGLLNFFWLAVLRRPAASAALSLG